MEIRGLFFTNFLSLVLLTDSNSHSIHNFFCHKAYITVIFQFLCALFYNNLHVTMKSIYYTSKHSQAILPKFPTTELVGEESSAISTVIGGLRKLCKYSTSSNSTTKMKTNETTSRNLLVT